MKLFENMEELGGSIQSAIVSIAEEMFGKEIDEAEAAEIANRLKLSDILILDQAYTNGDQDAVAKILDMDLVEYSMGAGRQATSAASSRPVVTKRDQAERPKAGGNSGVKPTPAYSGGVQNGVTTTNIDREDDDEEVAMDQQVEESAADSFNSDEVIRALEGIAADEEGDDPELAAGLQAIASRIYQRHPDSVRMSDIYNMLREPDLRTVRRDDIEYALQAAGIIDFMENCEPIISPSPLRKLFASTRELFIAVVVDQNKKMKTIRFRARDKSAAEKLLKKHGNHVLVLNTSSGGPEGIVEDQAGIESALRDMAEKYQAAMAGMYHEDPSDIAARMEELAAEHGIDVEDYFESTKKADPVLESIKRLAGIIK